MNAESGPVTLAGYRSESAAWPSADRVWSRWAVAGLILLGLVVRLLYSLRSSLYVDEFTTIWAARQALAHGLPWLPSGVLYTRGLFSVWLQAATIPLLGESEWAARVPSVLIGTITLPLLYQLGRRLFGTPAALVATATLALFPDAIVWGGRARFYALFHLLIVAQLLAFWDGFRTSRGRVEGGGGRRARWGWLLLVGAGLWTAEQTVLLLPVFAVGILRWRGLRWLRTREAARLGAVLAGLLAARAAFELVGQPGQLAAIQESRPYFSPLADLSGALVGYARVFLAPEWIVLLLPALSGLLLVWRGRRELPLERARLEGLLLVEMAFWLPLLVMTVAAGPDWRDRRYLFMLVPPLVLLAGAVAGWLLAAPSARFALRSRGRGWVLAAAVALPLVVLARPAAAAVESQVEGYDLAFRRIRAEWQPGDAVIGPQPPACAVYFGPCQGYAVSNGWEPFVVRRDGALVDRWTGSPLIRDRAGLEGLVRRHPRTWVVLDSLRVATRYDPEMIYDFARLGSVVWTGRGVIVLRLDGWREPPELALRAGPLARFEGGAELRGLAYGAPSPSVEGGGASLVMPLVLHWTAAGPFASSSLFVHLTAADGRLVAQDDGPPARGLFPTFLWGGGRLVPDPRELVIPSDARGWHRLSAGLYDSVTGGARPLLDGQGRPAAGDLTLDYLWLGPPPAEPAREIGAGFGDLIVLRGTDLPETVTATAGATLEIPLLWEATGTPERDLTVFLHVVGVGGAPLAQSDRQPTAGFFPTGRWQPGDRVPDSLPLTLPRDLPAGEYRLLVGLYDAASGVRLALPDGRDAFPLATLRVVAGGAAAGQAPAERPPAPGEGLRRAVRLARGDDAA